MMKEEKDKRAIQQEGAQGALGKKGERTRKK